jgi:hypothetical protein
MKRKCAQDKFSSLATRAEARYFTALEAISIFKMGIVCAQKRPAPGGPSKNRSRCLFSILR